MDRIAATRHTYVQGQKVYEWDQSVTEVNIFFDLPPGVGSKQLSVTIATKHITIGIKGNNPYIDKDLGGAIKTSESYWTIEDGVLHLQLSKAEEASTWASAFVGHELDPNTQQEDQKRLMLERFQAEHPGFDFSGAEFTGTVPDPRTFMRDINRQQ